MIQRNEAVTIITSSENPLPSKSNEVPRMNRVSVPVSKTEEKQKSITVNLADSLDSERQRPGVRSSFLDYKQTVVDYQHDANETISQRNTRIRNRRGSFIWLPVFFANDLLHGLSSSPLSSPSPSSSSSSPPSSSS